MEKKKKRKGPVRGGREPGQEPVLWLGEGKRHQRERPIGILNHPPMAEKKRWGKKKGTILCSGSLIWTEKKR